jgi:hypothetical protein
LTQSRFFSLYRSPLAVLGLAGLGIVLVELPHLLDRESLRHDQNEAEQHRQCREESR